MTGASRGVVEVAHGPRAVEARLCALVAELEAAALASGAFSLPVRIAVPSRSLLLHVRSALVRAAGRARIGVDVQTLLGVARGILERAGERVPHGKLLFPAIVEREARREPGLAELASLQDGFAVLATTVADLLDAGLDPARTRELEASLPGVGREAERARAILRVAAAAQRRLGEAGIGRESDALFRAAELLRRDARLVAARALVVHGFADATGAAAELLRALVHDCGARMLLDLPPDPARPGSVDASAAFTERLRKRIGVAALAVDSPTEQRAEIALVRAPSPTAEVRHVACRVRALLDGGVRPESIGVVARALEPYAQGLRTHLGRLAIPFSGVDALAARGPLGRRALAALEVLLRRERVAVDVWLDALAESATSAEHRADLRVGLHVVGAARLELVASLDVDALLGGRAWLALPVRRGLASVAAESGNGEDADAPTEESPEAKRTTAPRRRLAAESLHAAVASARALLERLATWPNERPLADHREALRALLAESFAWSSAEVALALAELDDCPDAGVALDAVAFGRVADGLLRDFGRDSLGGSGGGVQVLDVTAARARTFDHLFVLGMHRDGFPRIVSEDALLSDARRKSLLHALPDLALKERGHDEERYLFAQLLAASPRPVLSWAAADDEDRARAPSPLVERLRLAPGIPAPADALALYSPEPHPGPRPAYEHAILAALYGARRRVEPALVHAFGPRLGAPEARLRARARAAALAEFDFAPGDGASAASSLGPFFGFVGQIQGEGDPRQRSLHVTALEGLARCPWQTFVEKLLPIDEVRDALEQLPGLSPLLVGNAVHVTLERIVHSALGEERDDLARALAAEAVLVPWPDDAALAELLARAAEDVLFAAGIPHRGLARALARRARPYLEVAKRDWSEGPVRTVGAELEGRVQAGGPRPIHFRADRVDRDARGLQLTDYKTGRLFTTGVREETRRRHVAEGIARGQTLQAAAYAFGEGVRDARGRYFFLKPDAAPDHAVLEVDGADAQLRASFEQATRVLLEAWDGGAFLPRLVQSADGGEPGACRWCRVRPACVQGDSGMRARLRAFAASEAPPENELERTLRAVLVDLAPGAHR